MPPGLHGIDRLARAKLALHRRSAPRDKRPSKPYEFIGFGAMDVTKPYSLYIWFGDIHGPKPCEFIGFRWAFTSQTPGVLPGRDSGFRARCRPDFIRKNINIGPPAGLRPAGGPIVSLSRFKSGRPPARKPDFRPGSIFIIAQHRVEDPVVLGQGPCGS